MMYIDNEVLEKMIMTIVEGFDRIEKKLDRMNRLKDCLDGDTLLDNCDLAQLLGVTQRTIARYREKGLIRYYQTDENGKNFIVVRRSGSFCSRKERKNPEYCFCVRLSCRTWDNGFPVQGKGSRLPYLLYRNWIHPKGVQIDIGSSVQGSSFLEHPPENATADLCQHGVDVQVLLPPMLPPASSSVPNPSPL